MLKKIRCAALRARALRRLVRRSKSALLLSAISLASLQTSPLSAQTWDGGGANSNWNTAGNWAGDVLPVSGAANLTITMAGSTQTSNNQNLANPFQLQSLVQATGSSSFSITGSPLEFKNLGAAPTIVNNSNNSFQISNNLILTNNLTITQAAAGSTYFYGAISGTGGISVNASTNFSGSASNTYTGLTTVGAGRSLSLSKSTGFIAIAGDLSIAGNVSLNSSDEQIANTSTVALNGGDLYIGNLIETIAALQFTGGSANIGTFGKLIVNGNIDTNASANTAYIYGNLDLGGSVRTLTVADGTTFNDLEISAAITSAGIIKAGAGRLNLSAASNTWTGAVTINAGTLVGNSGNLNTAIVNNAALEFYQNSDGTYAQTISGTGTLTKSGSAKLTLTGTSSGSATTITEGILALGASSRLASTSNLTISNSSSSFDLATFDQTLGTVTLIGGNITGTGTLTASALDVRSGNISANLAGTAALVKTTSNTVTLTGTNTFTGGTTITAGTLQVSNLTGNVVNNATFNFNNPADTTYSGNISGTGNFSKLGAGVLTLAGTNTYSGSTTVSAGTLKLAAATALPTSTNLTLSNTAVFDMNGFNATLNSFSGDSTTSILLGAGQLTLGGSTTYAGSITGTGGITKAVGSTLTLTNAAYTGPTNVLGGTLDTNFLSSTANVLNNGSINYTVGADQTMTGNITGTGSFTKSGSAVLTLAGTNTYSGSTTINGGTLKLAAATAFPANTSLSLNNNAIFDLNGSNVTVSSFSGSSTTSILLGAGQLTLGGSTTYAGSITGTGGITKSASGTLTFTNAAYTGPTNVLGGTFNTNFLSSTANVLDNGSINYTVGADQTMSGNITGTGSFTKNGATVLTLTGTNTYTGTTTVNAGTVLLGSATALPNNTPLTLSGTAALDLNSFDATLRNFNGGNTTSIALGSGQLTFNNTSTSYQGSVSGTGGITLNGGSLSLANASYTGATNILNNGTFTTNSLSATANVLNNGALVYAVSTDRSIAGNISGTGYFEKNGSAELTLSGTNTYSGSTQVYGGALKLGSSTAMPANGSIYLGSNTTLDLNGYNASFNSFSGEATSAVTLGVGQLTLNSSYISYSGSISGTGGLTINGNSVTLTNASYTGTTIVGSGRSLETNFLAGSVQNNGYVSLNAATNQTISGDISGTGSFNKNGSGVLTLAGTNTFTGSMNVSAGSLKLASSAGLPTGGSLSLNSSTSLDMNSYNATLNYLYGDSTTAITLGGGHLSVGSGSFSGTLSGIGEFTKTGTSSFTLSNASYTGPTNVLGGSLSTNHLSNQASAAILNNGTLYYNQAADNTLAGSLSGSGSFVKYGNYLLTLSGTNTMTGTMSVEEGTLKIDAAVAIPTDAKYSLGNNATLNLNNFAATMATLNGSSSSTLSLGSAAVEIKSGTFQGSITGTGSVNKTGTGNLYLYGSGTYSGGTTLSGGTLQTSGTGRLGSGKLEVTSGNLYLGGTETVSEVRLIAGNISGGTLNAATYDVRNGTVNTNLVGTGSLTKTTAGTVSLYGTNSYSGGTTVTAGVLEGAPQSIQGDVANSALVRFTGYGPTDSVISGTGAVEIDGAYVNYINIHSYTGGTTVKNGTLETDPQALPGNTVLQNGSLSFVGSLSPHTYAGNITGTGSVSVNGGSGGVTLSGNNTFDGGLSVTQSLTIGSNTALGTGPISLSNATLNTSTVPVTVANDVTFNGDTTFGGGENLSFTQNAQRVMNSGQELVSNNTATVTINGQFIGRAGSLVQVNAGNLVVGDPNHLLGFQTLGDIQIASGATLTVRSSGFADIPALTTLTGGTLAASNGISLGASENIQGHGAVSGKVAAQIGSTIVATGNLSLGNATHVAGYYSDGELRVNNHQVTIYDKNEIVLGSVTEVGNSSGGGTLIAGAAVAPATNSRLFLLEPGKNVTGHGDVIGNFKNQGSVIGDGTALVDRLIFNSGWTVSGKGYFENTLILGTYAPGESPAIVTGTNQGFGGTLEFELGGLLPGSGPQNHDQVVDNAMIMLLPNTAISIKPWNNFMPSVGDQFVLMTWQGGLDGTFSNLLIDPVFTSNGLGFTLGYNNVGGTGNLTLTTTAIPEPGTMAVGVLGLVAGGVLLRRRRISK